MGAMPNKTVARNSDGDLHSPGAHGTKNNGLYQPAQAGASAAVQFNKVYPAPDMSNCSIEYRAAPDKRSSFLG